MKKVFAGKFDRKISLSKKATVESASGAVTYSDTNPIVVWASLFENKINNQVSEGLTEQVIMSRSVVYFLIRYIPNIDTEFRVLYQGQNLHIEAIEEVERKKYLKLRCEKIKGGIN